MRIFSKLNDYYDYVAYQYGIDSNIFFDRREYKLIYPGIKYDYYFIVEIGFLKILFKNEHDYKNDVDNICIVKKFQTDSLILNEQIKVWGNSLCDKKYKEYNNYTYQEYLSIKNNLKIVNIYSFHPKWYLPNFNEKYVTINDIIKGSRICQNGAILTSKMAEFIPADEAYINIYNYLSAQKTPNIVDNRTDIEKLISKGFDKKTSFRKM